MIKKIAIAASIAATLGSTGVAHAGYYETFNNFQGNFLINAFEDGDKKFNISLSGLDGTLGLQIPKAGTYGAAITPGSTVSINYSGNQGTDIFLPPSPFAIPVGSGTITSITGLLGISSMNFNFNGTNQSSVLVNGVNLVPAGLLPVQHVNVSGSGATNFFSILFGIPGFLAGNVSGTMGVDISFMHDQLNFVIDGTNLVGTNLEALVKALDDQPTSLNDGKIDGNFLVNGSVHIPEPGSMALIGLGLAGLAAARSRRSATKNA